LTLARSANAGFDFSSQRKRRLCGLLSWTEINESYNSQYKCV
jgi:hypothetical protein